MKTWIDGWMEWLLLAGVVINASLGTANWLRLGWTLQSAITAFGCVFPASILTALVTKRRRQMEATRRLLLRPALSGVPLPAIDDERWVRDIGRPRPVPGLEYFRMGEVCVNSSKTYGLINVGDDHLGRWDEYVAAVRSHVVMRENVLRNEQRVLAVERMTAKMIRALESAE